LVNFTPLGVTTQESPAFRHGECQQTPVEVTVAKRTQVGDFLFEPGEKLLVIAKVKSKATISGKGYVVYDEMTEYPFVVDGSIIEL